MPISTKIRTKTVPTDISSIMLRLNVLFIFSSVQVGINYLGINFPKYTSSVNEFIACKLGVYFISVTDVKIIIGFLSQANLNKMIAQKRKEKEISAEFK